jgi:hypothetical protein
VKKLIALLLIAAFVCAGSIGCGDTKPTSSKAGDAGKKADEKPKN